MADQRAQRPGDYLITGMPGTGKSSVLGALAGLGYETVDADTSDYCHWVASATGRPSGVDCEPDMEWVWHEPSVAALLARAPATRRYVGATAANQARFYPRFTRLFVLQVEPEVLAHRLAARGAFASHADELDRVLEFAPRFYGLMLDAGATSIDCSGSVADAASAIVELS